MLIYDNDERDESRVLLGGASHKEGETDWPQDTVILLVVQHTGASIFVFPNLSLYSICKYLKISLD